MGNKALLPVAKHFNRPKHSASDMQVGILAVNLNDTRVREKVHQKVEHPHIWAEQRPRIYGHYMHSHHKEISQDTLQRSWVHNARHPTYADYLDATQPLGLNSSSTLQL